MAIFAVHLEIRHHSSVRLATCLGVWTLGALYLAGSAAAYPNAPVCAVSREEPANLTELTNERHLSTCVTPSTQSDATVQADDSLASAKKALVTARAYEASGQTALARLQLNVVEWALPELSDRFALERAELLMKEGLPSEACQAFAQARLSPDSTVVAKSRVGEVRCLLAARDKRAGVALDGLLKHYPSLPEALELKLQLGHVKEHWQDAKGALTIYRAIDLKHPGSLVAEQARQRIEVLRKNGVTVAEYTLVQRLARAAQLVHTGPFELARTELSSLLNAPLSQRGKIEVSQLASQLARRDGGSDESHQLMLYARKVAGTSEGQSTVASLSPSIETAQQQALSRIARIVKGRSYARLTAPQLKAVMTIAINANLSNPAELVLESLSEGRRRILPAFRYEMALLAVGVVHDEHIVNTLTPILTDRRYSIGAQYHYGRALERSGKLNEAAAVFRALIAADTGPLPYYRMWAEQRLKHLQRPTDRGESTGSQPLEPMSLPELAASLHNLALNYKEAYPWIGRARQLIELGELSAASDELHEGYLAWRAATGRATQRVGLASVYKGRAIRLGAPSPKVRRARRDLNLEERQTLAAACVALGDYGTAIGLAGWQSLKGLPRPHHQAVRAIAKEHGLDPNLLLAVMRVESVYQKRIISYAGAMGLMQIMPRTGTLIAQKMGAQDFNTTELLDPQTNIKFAAWYLSSLLKRFDGVLPLAIAAYNGGPHNVRKWLTLYSNTMPLDAFLEHIPFGQTHRYVRRVLTHYAQYRAQVGLPMVQLTTRLPKLQTSTVAF